MPKMYELTFSYRIVKKYIVFTFKKYFDKFTVIGIENLPNNSPIIFAPNHLNALMDALAIQAISTDDQSISYLARADVFRKKIIRKILEFSKIMPAFRIRDGYENLGKNAESFDMCKEILKKNQALCIMPEGNQEIERNVRPLVKGIFRVAFAAQQEIDDEIFIVPVGLDYEDLIKFGKNLIINIGMPINIKEYMKMYSENPVMATNKLKEKLKSDLTELTVHLDTNNNYDCFETAFNISTATVTLQNINLSIPEKQFALRSDTAKLLVSLEKEKPQEIETLRKLCESYNQISKKLNFKIDDIKLLNASKKDLLIKTAKLILMFPVFAIGFIFNALPYFTPVLVRKKVGIKFVGFYSSVYYVSGAVSFPLLYLLQSILISTIFGLNAWFVLLLLPIHYYSGKFAFYGWYKTMQEVSSIIKIKKLSNKSEDSFQKLKKIINEITNIATHHKK